MFSIWLLFLVSTNAAAVNFCPPQRTAVPVSTNPLPTLFSDTFTTIDTMLKNYFNNHDVAVIVDIAQGSTSLFQQNYGNLPCNGDTIFRIGSNTKTFTSAMAFQLQEMGWISTDFPLYHYAEDVVFSNFLLDKQTTQPSILDVLSQVSGLPSGVPCALPCNISNTEMFQRMKSVMLQTERGTMPYYSNLGFALVGRVLEHWYNMDYQQYIKDNITTPLAMTSTGGDFTPEVMKRMQPIYNGTADLVELGWAFPAGGMYSTVNDLRRFTAGQLAGGKLFKTEAARRDFQKTRFYGRDGKYAQGTPFEGNITVNHYLVNKKGGEIGVDTSGKLVYISQSGIVDQLNLAINVLTAIPEPMKSNVRDAYAMMWEHLIPVVDQYYATHDTPTPVPPTNSKFGKFSGSYKGNTTPLTFTVTLVSSSNGYVYSVSAPGFPTLSMNYIKFDGETRTVYFRLYDPTSLKRTCEANLLADTTGSIVSLNIMGDDPTSWYVQVPSVFYGTKFQKQ